MLVGGEEDPVPVLPLVSPVGQLAQAQDVSGLIQRDPILGIEPAPGQHLLGDGAQRSIAEARGIRRSELLRHAISF